MVFLVPVAELADVSKQPELVMDAGVAGVEAQ